MTNPTPEQRAVIAAFVLDPAFARHVVRRLHDSQLTQVRA